MSSNQMRLTATKAAAIFLPDRQGGAIASIKSPCHPTFNVKVAYIPLDGILALECKLCGKPIASFLIADTDLLDRPPDGYPDWTEHHKRVISLWELQNADNCGADERKALEKAKNIERQRKLIRQHWLGLSDGAQKLGLHWYHSNRVNHGYKMYLGHEEP